MREKKGICAAGTGTLADSLSLSPAPGYASIVSASSLFRVNGEIVVYEVIERVPDGISNPVFKPLRSKETDTPC